LRWLAILLAPIMPERAREMWNQLGLHEERIDANWDDALRWGTLAANTQTKPADALFPRIDVTPAA